MEPPSPPTRILFVDDEPMITRVGRRALVSLGYQPTIANDGAEAWELMQQEPLAFDLIISDQTMPGLTGLELLDNVRKIHPDLPFILSTGYAENFDISDALARGAQAMLSKPFQLAELREIVERVLNSAHGPPGS
ncbi:response regulator [Synoicihabitans lomoniglobus]|uniref:Response regulator n=1 Tax=Synoicihabitans lomoniglobus TaxID=2909285 RepID=A0AAE9ZYT9_9BACT|nr:response regulator [Opitutaceae bacterium LMO-M01]WED65590.1 response regulator [Opitutaceae bacterium LMO-M01]